MKSNVKDKAPWWYYILLTDGSSTQKILLDSQARHPGQNESYTESYKTRSILGHPD